MKFLQKLIPDFLNKIDHRLLVNKPVIWRTKAHYLLFYAAIFSLIVFSIGCLYPHSIYKEVYESSDSKENAAIFITCAMSLIVIVFWSTRLYQYQMKISRWKHFFYTFCIYFSCLFILFTSVFSFHYGSYINKSRLLVNFNDSYQKLSDNNFHLPVYFPHYQPDPLRNLDDYLQNGQALSKQLYQKKNDANNAAYSYNSSRGYLIKPIEFYERQNIIKEYLESLEAKDGSIEVKNTVPEIYQAQQEQLAPQERINNQAEIAKRALKFNLGEEQEELLKSAEVNSEAYFDKINQAKNTFSKEEFSKILSSKNPKLVDGRFSYQSWSEHIHLTSAMLFRYEHYVRLRTFLESLNEQQYQAYYQYLDGVDAREQDSRYLDEHKIQYHELNNLLIYEVVIDTVQLFSQTNMKTPLGWFYRFQNRDYLLEYPKTMTNIGTRRAELLNDFLQQLDSKQVRAYKEYVHFARILNQEIENSKVYNVFTEETGLDNFVYGRCVEYFALHQDKVDRMDSILFFNYFDSEKLSIKLGQEYYPKIIQKRYFDQFYASDLQQAKGIGTIMMDNHIVNQQIGMEKNFSKDPDMVYKRQFLHHAFESIGITRSEATSFDILLGFLIANFLGSFCFAIMIFYLSSVERNTILLAMLIMGLIYIILLGLGTIANGLVGGAAILFYLLFSASLFIVFYKPRFQIKKIKLIITSYIFYAITIQFFMLTNEDYTIGLLNIQPELFAFSVLLFTFCVLFFFSYYFIRYIQLPTKV